MIRRYLAAAAAVLGLAGGIMLCLPTLRPVMPAIGYSVMTSFESDHGVGIVILAPKGSDSFKQKIKATVGELKDRFPVEIAFGSAEPVAVHVAVEKLKARGVETVIMIPLLTSSYSVMMKQTRYILGLGEPPGALGYVAHPVPIDVPFVLGDCMDTSPLIAEIIADRAAEQSRTPENETLIIVAEGMADEKDDALFRRNIAKMAGLIRLKTGFKRIIPVTLREDPDSAHALRKLVKSESVSGRVIVVSLALYDEELNPRLTGQLYGLDYSFNGKGLIPHPKFIQWLKDSIDKQLIKLNWERLAGDSVTIAS